MRLWILKNKYIMRLTRLRFSSDKIWKTLSKDLTLSKILAKLTQTWRKVNKIDGITLDLMGRWPNPKQTSMPMQYYNVGCQYSSSRSIASIQLFASRISHGEQFWKIHRFCCFTLKILIRQNLVLTSSYGWGWSPPCEATRTYKPSSFLVHLHNLSPCNSFCSYEEKHSSIWNQPHNTNQAFLQLNTEK